MLMAGGRRSGRDYMDNKHAARIAMKHVRWKLVRKKASTALATPDAGLYDLFCWVV